VIIDDINFEEIGREWKNLFGAQKTITYALTPTKKVTREYGRPCIYLCNPDADIFRNNDSKTTRRSWLEDNLFGGKPIYLEVNFVNGQVVKNYNRFAGDIRCENIAPGIRKHIEFSDDEFDDLPSAIQKIYLDRAIKDYVIELDNRMKYRNYYEASEFYDGEFYTDCNLDNRECCPNCSIDNLAYKYANCNVNGVIDENVNYGVNIATDDYVNAAAEAYVNRYVAEY
jgi:hypothetical protein